VKAAFNTQEQRLHPLSWLLGLLGQLPSLLFFVIITLLTTARGNSNHGGSWFLIVIVVSGSLLAVLVPVLQYLTYHYHIEHDRLIVRSGILARTRREIPFTRIHNVVLHQNLWHRLFNVAELRLESAAGNEPEAHMRVLTLDQALALERLIRGSAVATPAMEVTNIPPTSTKNNVTTPNTLLTLPLAEQIRLGLLSNQAWIGLIALFGIAQQFMPEKIISEQGASWAKQADSFLAGNSILLIGIIIGLCLLTWVVMQVASVLLTIVQYHGFKLTEIDKRLTVERGLFTRRRSSVARRRIQSWTLYEGILQRLLGRRRLQVDIASVAQPNLQEHASVEAERDLVPLASIAVTNHLLQHLLPKLQWPVPYWQSVALGQWWRLCLPTLLPLTIISALACWQWGAQGMWVWLWLGWSMFKARRHIMRMGWALDGPYLIIRHGWWRRTWRLIELEKLQGLQLKRSPLDRWFGTATLHLDSAGAIGSPPLQLRLLPYARACRLLDHLTQETAQRKLQW